MNYQNNADVIMWRWFNKDR